MPRGDRGACAGRRTGDRYLPYMDKRYDQADLNVYGAQDDEEMDSILDALERANRDQETKTS